MAASEKGVLEVVQALLQAGAAVNAGKPVGGVLSGLAIGVECGCLCVWCAYGWLLELGGGICLWN